MTAERFLIDIPQSKLDDLQRRLSAVNWPHDYENDNWLYGTNGAYLRELVEYWRDEYDWRAREKEMNAVKHYRAEIDGLPIHFVHERGVGPNPTPLILTHGWPWTFWDFRDVIGPLTDPAAHGGDPKDAFDVIIPSLPGFAFSTPVNRSGIHWGSTADLWVKLMRDVLGYERFGAHGGDWGALVTMQLGHKHAKEVMGIHLTNAFPMPVFDGDRPWSIGDAAATNAQGGQKDEVLEWEKKFSSHVAVHMLDPQTLAFAMHDSPVGLCAWILERRRAWGDCGGDVESRFSKEHLLDTMSLYWLTDSFVTSVRYYSEASRYHWTPSHDRTPVVEAPAGLSLFRYDMAPAPADWTKAYFNEQFLRVRESGGHFAAYEEPKAVVEDIRDLFRPMR